MLSPKLFGTIQRELSVLAHTDPLTGLLTQRSFYDILDKEWHRSARCNLPMSCVMIDLDFFKQINDVHGHPTGDSVLMFTAELLLDNCRASDTICRYGGEEFCALLPETNESNAGLWAERARKRLGALCVPICQKDIHVSGSFGVAERHNNLPNAETLVKMADQALLCAKRSGRDRVVHYTATVEDDKPIFHAAHWHDNIFNTMVAHDIMSPLVVTLDENSTIEEAARLFCQSGILSSPVVGADGTLAGLITEKDLMGATASMDCWRQPLGSVMQRKVICYEEETPIRVIHDFLCRNAIRGVIITKDGRPTGTVNRASLLRCFFEWNADPLLPFEEKHSHAVGYALA